MNTLSVVRVITDKTPDRSEKLFPPLYSLLKRAGLGSTANGGTHSKRY